MDNCIGVFLTETVAIFAHITYIYLHSCTCYVSLLWALQFYLLYHVFVLYRWEEKLPMSKSSLESTWLYHEIGRCHLEMGKHSEAKDYGEKSLKAAEEANDDVWQLNASVLIAQSEGESTLIILS